MTGSICIQNLSVPFRFLSSPKQEVLVATGQLETQEPEWSCCSSTGSTWSVAGHARNVGRGSGVIVPGPGKVDRNHPSHLGSSCSSTEPPLSFVPWFQNPDGNSFLTKAELLQRCAQKDPRVSTEVGANRWSPPEWFCGSEKSGIGSGLIPCQRYREPGLLALSESFLSCPQIAPQSSQSWPALRSLLQRNLVLRTHQPARWGQLQGTQ